MVHVLFRTLDVSEDVSFVITSSLSKDISGDFVCLRANALRTIVRILDSQTAVSFERQLNTAIVSEKPFLAATALFCCFHLQKICPELVKRCLVQIAGQMNSSNATVQAHAIQVLSEVNKNDRLALHRSITNFASAVIGNPVAETYLIGQCRKLLEQQHADSNLDSSLLEYLNLELTRTTEDMVALEAAKSAIALALECPKFNNDPERFLNVPVALNILKEFLEHDKDMVRYASIRVLYHVARKQPRFLSTLCEDIEPLLTDSCKPVAVLALITLLKCDAPHDKKFFMKQVGDLIVDVSDSQKVEIINALEESCLSDPQKVATVVKFIAAQLRDEGGKKAKACAVSTLTKLSSVYPAIHEECIADLCDFIEDCEHQSILIYIISFLGLEIPKTKTPGTHLRILVNRAILETPGVRAAAVDAMTSIAQQCPELAPAVVAALKSHMVNDTNDEVREVVHYSLKVLGADVNVDGYVSDGSTTINDLLVSEDSELEFSVDALIDECNKHLAHNNPARVDVNQLPSAAEYEEQKLVALRKTQAKAGVISSAVDQTEGGAVQPAAAMSQVRTQDVKLRVVETVAKFTENRVVIENVDAISTSMLLTETEAEYQVKALKYVCDQGKYIVVQVNVTNTIESQVLEHVELRTSRPNTPVYKVALVTTIPELPYNMTKSIWMLMEREQESDLSELLLEKEEIVLGTTLAFTVNDGDDSYPDDYAMNQLKIRPEDLFGELTSSPGDMMHRWQQLEAEEQVVKLNYGTQQDPSQIVDAIKKLPNSYVAESPFGAPGQVFVGLRLVGGVELYTLFHIVRANKGTLAKVAIRSVNPIAVQIMSKIAAKL
ncbi:coatomer subunit gamma [Gregarina niphandrodes]|uniref:Coatomer subunit gamma n=1 Tax=Gregarina niphandrodes TaxID=110365 RepID=A0A023B2Q1_GRENI|nr:coatomer subunit gamma [Gregarina niphandrodes]EZG55088.1 coatomer subunit gamma [Gregarina niphandrodes]|eukprot:XP_011131791.1 coatomer subunit gamma [Gregarina niphandrodes]